MTTKRRELATTVVISFAFFFIFSAFMSIQNLQSSLNQEQGLGVVTLSLVYGFLILSGFITPTIVTFIGPKWALTIGWVSHCCYTLANFYPTWGTLIPAAIFLGFMSAPVWTSQCLYISECAFNYAELSHEESHTVLSRFNGIFFTIFNIASICGNLISSLLLYHDTGISHHSGNMTLLQNETLIGSNVTNHFVNPNMSQYCGSRDCLSTETTVTSQTHFVQPEVSVIYTLLGVFLAMDVVGLVLTIAALPPLSKKPDVTGLQTLLSCIKLPIFNLKMLLLLPYFMYIAMSNVFLWAEYTKAFVSCSLGIGSVGFTIAVYWGSSMVFCSTLSHLAKYTGHKPLIFAEMVIGLGVYVVLAVWTPSPEHVYAFYVIPAIWGICESVWQTQWTAFIAIVFEEQRDAAFANVYTARAIGCTLTFAYSKFICIATKLYIIIGVLLVSATCYWAVEVMLHLEKKKPETKKAYEVVALTEKAEQ